MRRKVSAHRNCEGNQYDLPREAGSLSQVFDDRTIKGKIKKGYMILFEEGSPIHTVVLLRDSKTGKIWRFSDGKKSVVTVEKENARRCTNEKYKGIIAVK